MNPFKNGTPWFPYRWFFVFAMVIIIGMGFSDYFGWRALSFPAFNGGSGGGVHGYSGSTFFHK